MELVIDNSQLDNELQELYIVSSHWNSDIIFVQDEIRFLKKLLNKYRIDTAKLQLNEYVHFNKILELQNAVIPKVKIKVADFLKFIEPFINNSKKDLGLDMLEKFSALETEIKSLADYVRLVKKLVFVFIEDAIKTGKCTALSSSPNKPMALKYKL